MPIKDKICTRCGQTGLWWAKSADEKFLLHDSFGLHKCADKPVTTASAVARTPGVGSRSNAPSISADVEQMARAAVLDMVAKITESFTRTIDARSGEHEASIRAIVADGISRVLATNDDAFNAAMAEFRNQMPQRHDLYVTAPDHTAIMPDVKPHFQLQSMVEWLNIRKHVWAGGPAGSGKTTAAEQAANVLSLPVYVLPCGMSTNDWSLLGFTNPSGQYVPGHMRKPFEHGGVFVLDEIDNTNPSVLTTINGALSGKSYQFPDALVQRHPDFVVVGCANTWGTGPDRQYVGRNQLDAATLDRFIKVPWGYDEDAEYDWAGRDQSVWVDYVQRVRQCVNELSMRVVVSPRASISGAAGLRNGISWNRVAAACIWDGIGDDDRTRLQSIVGRG